MEKTTPTQLRVPAYLEGAAMHAHVEHRCRLVSWTLDAGEIHRNQFQWANISVRERNPWSGEPLDVWGSRCTSSSFARGYFTDAACELMRADILPGVARFGFDRLWMGLSRQRQAYHCAESAWREVEVARRTAEWWELKAELYEMHEAGVTDFVPLDRSELCGGGLVVRVTRAHGQRFSSEAVAARVRVGGEHVGWVLADGGLVPLDGGIG